MVSLTEENVEVSLAEGAVLSSTAVDVVEFRRGDARLRLKRLDRGVTAALCRLAEKPVGYVELETSALAADPHADVGRLLYEVARLVSRSLVLARCVVNGEELLRATAISRLSRFDVTASVDGVLLRLSRFAYVRRQEEAMVIESPASYARVEVREPALGGLLFRLAAANTADRLCTAIPGLSADAARAALGFLLGVGVVTVVDGSETTADDVHPQVAQREFHDVLMHSASRCGLGDQARGTTFRFRGAHAPLPAVRELPDGAQTPLPVPDRGRFLAEDRGLAQVIEDRRSIWEHGAEPITIDQLGEFLFRVARVDSIQPADEAAGRSYETTRRPYPSGGACYDLELYLTVHRCTGLGAGIYHYDPAGHRLTRVSAKPDLVRQMLLAARSATASPMPPQVLVTLASRFGRLGWKYEGIAYATTLKNVGVMYQTMYLTATAMGLAPCALGAGDSAAFARATRLDPLVESSVGEFTLGTRGDR